MKKCIEREIEKRAKEIIAARRKVIIVEYIISSKNSVFQKWLDFKIPRSTFYEWKKKYSFQMRCAFHLWRTSVNN